MGNNDAAAAEDEREKKKRARPPLTLMFLFLLPGRSSQVRFPESQQCGLIEGRFVIDLQGGRRIYTGLSRWYFCFFPCSVDCVVGLFRSCLFPRKLGKDCFVEFGYFTELCLVVNFFLIFFFWLTAKVTFPFFRFASIMIALLLPRSYHLAPPLPHPV